MSRARSALWALSALPMGLGVAQAQVVATGAPQQPPAAPAPAAAAPSANGGGTVKQNGEARVVVDIFMNGEPRGTALVLRRDGQFYLPSAATATWGLRKPEGAPTFEEGGQSYYALGALRLEFKSYDRREGRLDLTAPAAAFEASSFDLLAGQVLALSPAAWTAFFNYDLLGTTSGSEARTLDGAFQLVGSSPYGSLTYAFVQRGIVAEKAAVSGHERLFTTYRYDWPSAPATLELGDSIVRPGNFGSALRFGGVALYSNYGLRPGFVLQPLPTFAGEAALPSTVDVFINDQLRSSTNVPAGPFTLNEVPTITGAGEARVVVRDALGREQVVNSSFYSAGELLRPGLSQYAFAAGRLRETGADLAPDYGNYYGSALWRQGITNILTLEARAESEENISTTVGGAATIGLPLGELELGLAANFNDGSTYGAASVGYNFLSSFERGLSLRWVQAQDGFRLAGVADPRSAVERQIVASAWQSIWRGATLGASYIEQRRADGIDTRSLSANLSWNLQPNIFLNVSAGRVEVGNSTTNLVRATITIPLGDRVSVSASAQGGTTSQYDVAVQQSLPLGEGYGYRVSGTGGEVGRRAEASVFANLPYARVGAQVAHTPNDSTATRLNLAGSLVTVGTSFAAAREIPDSVILVRAPDLPDAPIFLNNQPIGRTDADGELILPRVTSLVEARVGIDVDQLPPDVDVDAEQIRVVPPFRSGVYADLKVRRTTAALLRLTLPDGAPVPTGAEVEPQQPGAAATRVGPRGETFLQAQPGAQKIVVKFGDSVCTVDLDLAAAASGTPFQTLGPLPCSPIKR